MYWKLLLIACIGAAAPADAQHTVNHKGTRLQLDTSKWHLNGSHIYNKNAGRVGIGTAPDSNAALEVKVSDKGILIPRLALAALNNTSPLTTNQSPGLLLSRSLGSIGAETDITPGNFLGKFQFRGRLAGADADYGALMYMADAASAGGGHFGFTTGNLTTEIMSIRTDNSRVGVGTSNPQSTLDVKGSFAANINIISTATTLDDSHHFIVMNSGSSVTLPAASTCAGRVYHIRNASGINKTITLSGSATTLPNNRTLTCVSDGTVWHRFGTAP